MDEKNNFQKKIKPYTSKQLADQYGVCVKTFAKWIKPFVKDIGVRNGQIYSIKQVIIIYDKLGEP